MGLPLGMVGFHVFNPVLFLFTKIAHPMIHFLYRTVGVPGIMAMPWIMLSTEKCIYDSFLALRGVDQLADYEENGAPHGGFPSGGSGLPSFSLVPVASEEKRLIISILGDPPRKTSAVTAAVVNSDA